MFDLNHHSLLWGLLQFAASAMEWLAIGCAVLAIGLWLRDGRHHQRTLLVTGVGCGAFGLANLMGSLGYMAVMDAVPYAGFGMALIGLVLGLRAARLRATVLAQA